MTEQLLHIDVILVSFWSELQLKRAQSQVLGLASLLCANVKFVCDIIIDARDKNQNCMHLAVSRVLYFVTACACFVFYASVYMHTQVVCNQTNCLRCASQSTCFLYS